MKTFYIAGPMSGLPGLNFPAFHKEAARLRALGCEVVNPAEINGEDPHAVMTPQELAAHWRKCITADIKQLVDCDCIILLPGWERSRGATLEHHIARALGFEIILAAGRSPFAETTARVDWAAA